MSVSLRKIIKVSFVFILTIVCMVSAIFFTSVGRNIFIFGINKYCQYHNIIFAVNGMNKDTTKIKEIFVKTPSKSEFIFSDISFSKKSLFDKSSIQIKRLDFNRTRQVDTQVAKTEPLKGIISLVKLIRIFIADFSIEVVNLNCTRKYVLNKIKYKSAAKKDTFYCNIDNGQFVKIDFNWLNGKCIESTILFENIFGFSGKGGLINPEQNMANYHAVAYNDKIKIKTYGRCSDFASNIIVDNLTAKYGKYALDINGNIHLCKHDMQLKAAVKLGDVFVDAHPLVKSNFAHVLAVIQTNYNFNDDEKSVLTVDFVNADNNKSIGNAICCLQKNNVNVYCNVGWIEGYGFKLKTINCIVKELRNVFLYVNGDSFDVVSNLTYREKIIIDNITARFKNCGILQLKKAFTLKDNIECAFDYKFSNLDCFNKLIQIGGDITGNILYKNGRIIAKNTAQILKLQNYVFNKLNLFIDGSDVTCKISDITMDNFKISNVIFNLLKEKLTISCVTNTGFNVSATGKFVKARKRISLNKFYMRSLDYTINAKLFDLNLNEEKYKISCEVLNNRQKGFIDIVQNGNNISIAMHDIQTAMVNKIIKCKIPECEINSSINLQNINNAITGAGNLEIRNFISKNNVINAVVRILSDRLEINSSLIHKKEYFKADMSVPIVIKSNSKILYNKTNMMKCHFYANTKLENLFEFSDGVDIRGLLNCDVMITGSALRPQIKGNINFQKAYFMIYDLILKNGTINLICENSNINVVNAEFIDNNKNRAVLSGKCKLFFDDVMPNIDADIAMYLRNFTLFDSDNMKIIVNGRGNIAGKLGNLLISGNVVIPKCDILKFNVNDVVDDDIIIENEKRPFHKTINSKNDFCNYNIKMDCPNINIIGEIFNLCLTGKLLLTTYDNKATFVGPLNLKHGRLDLFGKRMKVIEASIKFYEKYHFDPEVKVLCANNFNGMIAYLSIINQPGGVGSVNLYSIPNYPQDVILSNIIFGKDLKYLNVTEAAQLAHMIASFKSDGYIFSILNTFQKIGVIDNISFSDTDKKYRSLYTNEQTESQYNANISAGKYIHDNIYVSVNKTQDENVSFDVDLSITDNLSVKVNTNGEAGLSWKYRF